MVQCRVCPALRSVAAPRRPREQADFGGPGGTNAYARFNVEGHIFRRSWLEIDDGLLGYAGFSKIGRSGLGAVTTLIFLLPTDDMAGYDRPWGQPPVAFGPAHYGDGHDDDGFGQSPSITAPAEEIADEVFQ